MQYNILGQEGLNPDVVTQSSTIIRPEIKAIALPGDTSGYYYRDSPTLIDPPVATYEARPSVGPGPEPIQKEFYDRTQKYETFTESPETIDYGPGPGEQISPSIFAPTTYSTREDAAFIVDEVLRQWSELSLEDLQQLWLTEQTNYSPEFLKKLIQEVQYRMESIPSSSVQSLDADVIHTSSEIRDPAYYEAPENVIQIAEGPGGPGGDLDLTIDPGSDVGQVLDTLSRWGMVDTVVDANNHVSATLTQKGKTTLWGGAAAIGGYILYRKFGAKKPRKRTYKKKKKK